MDEITQLMESEGIGFPEAVERILQQRGCPYQRDDGIIMFPLRLDDECIEELLDDPPTSVEIEGFVSSCMQALRDENDRRVAESSSPEMMRQITDAAEVRVGRVANALSRILERELNG